MSVVDTKQHVTRDEQNATVECSGYRVFVKATYHPSLTEIAILIIRISDGAQIFKTDETWGPSVPMSRITFSALMRLESILHLQRRVSA